MPVADSGAASHSDEDLGAFFRALPNRDGIQNDQAIQDIPAKSAEAKLLKIRSGQPILPIEVTYSDSDGNPLEHLRANYRGDRFRFQLDI